MSQELKERTEQYQEQPQTQPSPAKKGGSGLVKVTAAMSALALVISCAALFIALKPQPPQQEPQDEVDQVQPMMVEVSPTVSYRDRELPVWENVPLNQYDPDCIQVDSQGWLRYEGQGVEGKVGIDAEPIGREYPLERQKALAARFFSEDERNRLSSGEMTFTELWTRREAYLKMTGEGFANGIGKKIPDSTFFHFFTALGFAFAVATERAAKIVVREYKA